MMTGKSLRNIDKLWPALANQAEDIWSRAIHPHLEAEIAFSSVDGIPRVDVDGALTHDELVALTEIMDLILTSIMHDCVKEIRP